MITNDTINRFFLQECSSEEAASVLKYLEENPERIEEFLNEEDWNNFQSTHEFPKQKVREMWTSIYGQTIKKTQYTLLFRKIAIAASVLALVIAGGLLLTNQHSSKAISGINFKTGVQRVKNTGVLNMKIVLSDSSTIVLMPQSSLTYPNRFDDNRRIVHLWGEARFTIAKNKQRPFTVYSDGLATTALGTQFSITSFPADSTITLKLFEGKVVIKSADSLRLKLPKDYFLLAGDVFSYNKLSKKASITNPDSSGSKGPLSAGHKNNSSSAGISSGNWYVFNNQSVDEVFGLLQTLYGKKIVYSKKDVEGMTFIGKLDKSDSLEFVLHSIAVLNNLHVIRIADGYRISK